MISESSVDHGGGEMGWAKKFTFSPEKGGEHIGSIATGYAIQIVP